MSGKSVLIKANMELTIHINSWYTLERLHRPRVLSYAHLRKPRVQAKSTSFLTHGTKRT